jgi:hypothetical protein
MSGKKWAQTLLRTSVEISAARSAFISGRYATASTAAVPCARLTPQYFEPKGTFQPFFDHESFATSFLNEVKEMGTDPAQSSKVLRKLVKSKELKFMDMTENPEKFFMAHRLLTTIGLNGFAVRFTVQFNLFAGSIIGLAGKNVVIALLPDLRY